jgi:hypothetical protein
LLISVKTKTKAGKVLLFLSFSGKKNHKIIPFGCVAAG